MILRLQWWKLQLHLTWKCLFVRVIPDQTLKKVGWINLNLFCKMFAHVTRKLWLLAISIYWNLRENGTGRNEHAFVKVLNDFFLEQMNTCPTRGENIFDLVITSIPDRIKISEVLKPSHTEISTDHSTVISIFLCRAIPFQR